MQDRAEDSEQPGDVEELHAFNDPITPLDPSRRVYVNRNLRFEHIRQIGFDMDYTLAPYAKRNIEELAFRMTAERLVQDRGYPEAILELAYDPLFVVRGLVVDKRLGNIFKMDGHGHVGRVYHGHTALTKEERRKLYRSSKIRLSAARYHRVDTLFALPEVALYSSIIEAYEKQLGIKKVAYWKLFDDIRATIDTCHRDGSLKAIIKADLGRYIDIDPELPQTLHKLRSSNKRLFVLTNSEWDYTDAVMRHLLDNKLPEYPGWRNYFDLVIVSAQKPRFFQEHQAFDRIDPDTGKIVTQDVHALEHRGVYQGGSVRELVRHYAGDGDEVLYVGDHIYGDIIRSKRDSAWRTLLVIEELEAELVRAERLRRTQSDLEAHEEQRARLDHEIVTLKLQLAEADSSATDEDPAAIHARRRELKHRLDSTRRQLRPVIERRDDLANEIDQAFNPFWGSAFKEGKEVSRFGAQVEEYACMYTSRVSNLLNYSPTQYFRAPRHWMAHEKA